MSAPRDLDAVVADHARTEPPLWWQVTGHGLFYVPRDGRSIIQLHTLDDDSAPPLPRPERDVLLTLLRYYVERLERPNVTGGPT